LGLCGTEEKKEAYGIIKKRGEGEEVFRRFDNSKKSTRNPKQSASKGKKGREKAKKKKASPRGKKTKTIQCPTKARPPKIEGGTIRKGKRPS